MGNVYGAAGGTTSLPKQRSPYSHGLGNLCGNEVLQIQGINASIGASAALTTSQGFCIVPFPYFWLWDVVVCCTATGNVAGEQSIDIYNTLAAGTSANSYLYRGGGPNGTLTGAIPLGQNVSALQFYSARFPSAQQQTAGQAYGLTAAQSQNAVYKLANDAVLNAGKGGANFKAWSNTYIYPQGTIFSARALTPALGSITNLQVYIIGVGSDVPFDGT